MVFSPIIQLFRPHQYVKNLFIFLPLFFALKINQTDLLGIASVAFVAFCLCASAVYIFNDLADIEADRKHPVKCFRPLASRTVSIRLAVALMGILSLGGLGIMALLDLSAAALLVVYLGLNLCYSLWLKHVAILDITIIAVGFVLRLFVGAAVTGIPLSMWIVVMTFLLALFLALGKRRDDVLIFERTGEKMRRVVDGYNLKFVETAIAVMAAVVIVAYILYTITPEVIHRVHSDKLYLTSAFVVVGILRYMQISFVEERSGSPTTVVLRDIFMQLVLLGWIVSFSWIIYA